MRAIGEAATMRQTPRSQCRAAHQAPKQKMMQEIKRKIARGSKPRPLPLWLQTRVWREISVAKLKTLAAMFASGAIVRGLDMSELIVEHREELPEPSATLKVQGAVLAALVTVIAEHRGRRAAVRFLTMVEENLEDSNPGDGVVLIRGEKARQEELRNRRAGLNWVRRMSPTFVRRLGS